MSRLPNELLSRQEMRDAPPHLLLTNYAMDSQNRLCLLFCGQTELRRRLGMAVHEALNQRVVVRYHLPPLTREEAAQYIAHRLRRAGTELPVFEPAAVERMLRHPAEIRLLGERVEAEHAH